MEKPPVVNREAPGVSKDGTTEKKKPTFKEKREFEILEKEIADLNKEKAAINEKLNGNLPYDELQKLSNRIGEVTALLDAKEFRWLELSELVG
jgi:ATP-binding cassette subfamily F protein uup